MTNHEVEQKKINQTVWAACDTFRGVVDPSIYKDYVLTLLFLKYISDVWQDHYDDYKKRVTIEAPSDQVWPWLVQMGGDRGGWYSWDRLDNGGRPSAQEVHPE